MSSPVIADEVSAVCYLRQSWADPWKQVPDLQCLRLVDQAGPSHATASFLWRYGSSLRQAIGDRPPDKSWTTVPTVDLSRLYVKVVLSNGLCWYGVLIDSEETSLGVADGVKTGSQLITAFGLSWLLDEKPIRESEVWVDGVGLGKVGIVLPFNGGTGERLGGRVVNNRDSGLRVFGVDDSLGGPKAWDAGDALVYLLLFFGPRDAEDQLLLPWNVDADDDLLQYKLLPFDYTGKTLWQTLNMVVDRRRGLGVRFEVLPDESEVYLRVFSQFTEPTRLPDGTVLPGNPNLISLDISDANNILDVDLVRSAVHEVDQIRVIGERRGSVFSVYPAVQMEPDWESEEVDTYNAARSGDTGYDSLTDKEKAIANATFRADDKLRNVFTQWRLKKDWDGLANGEIVFPKVKHGLVIPDLEAGPSPHWPPGLRLESRTPLVITEDYTGELTAVEVPDPDDRLPMMVWFNHELAERMDAGGDVLADQAEEGGRQWSVQVRVMTSAAGLRLEVVGGQQHYIAEDLYVENGTYEKIEEKHHAVGHTSWVATVYMQQQEHVAVVWPLSSETEKEGGDSKRVLEIKAPGAHLDYLVPQTVVGVDHPLDGTSVYETAEGGWVRDNRDRMSTIGRLAWRYYGQVHNKLTLSWRSIAVPARIGWLVEKLSEHDLEHDVNTVVTSLEIDLQRQTTRIQTSFAEMDFSRFV